MRDALTQNPGELPGDPGRGLALGGLLMDQLEYQRGLEVAEEALGHRPDDEPLEKLHALLRVAVYGLEALPPGATVHFEEPSDEPDDAANG